MTITTDWGAVDRVHHIEAGTCSCGVTGCRYGAMARLKQRSDDASLPPAPFTSVFDETAEGADRG